MSKQSKKPLPLFNKPLRTNLKLEIEEGKYFETRGGWIAKIIYVSSIQNQCYAIHNPGTQYEVGPVFHEIGTGNANPLFGLLNPPVFTGHPADLIKEVTPN